MTAYIGILDGSGDVWGVRVPDVPGCLGGGPTPEAAIADAQSALHELAAESGHLPAPRPLRDVVADPAARYSSSTEALVVLSLQPAPAMAHA